MANNCRQTQRKQNEHSHQAMRIDVLPDKILLGLFDFYLNMYPTYNKRGVEAWQSLVHVCRRWRSLVFQSPRHLNLQLCCTPQTPAKDALDIWPALPLTIWGCMDVTSDMDNILAALRQSDNVCQVSLWGLAGWRLQEVLAAMQVPFPELIDLKLSSIEKTPRASPAIPDSFLGRSAPRLRTFNLDGIPFPGLPKLLLSITHLVSLSLTSIPHSGYISPEAMVGLISELSGLRRLDIGFESPQSCPDRESQLSPPSNRYVISTLYEFHYRGVTEYIEDLVTRIDTPQLDNIHISFFNQVEFDTPRLTQFINRTPTLRKPDAYVQFHDTFARIALSPGSRTFEITISCREQHWQLSFIEQICNSSWRLLSKVEDLYIEHRYFQLVWKDNAIRNIVWLQVLLPFTAVKNLYLSKEFAPGIAAALMELVGGGIIEMLPSLRNIFVDSLTSYFGEKVEQFVATRQLSNHPISIYSWDRFSNAKRT